MPDARAKAASGGRAPRGRAVSPLRRLRRGPAPRRPRQALALFMNLLVTGSSGLIGSALVPLLERSGHRVRRAVRRAPERPNEVAWNPGDGSLGWSSGAPLEGVVHLAGVSLSRRWTASLKRRAWTSRVDATRLLAERLAGRHPPPRVLVAASAVGYYGDRGDELLDESSARGAGFLSDMASAWEEACRPSVQAGVRVVHLRMGIVLARHGGALARLLPLFRLGLGGPLGDGSQYMSWIGLPDVGAVALHAMREDVLSGPVNAVAPEPVSNREFARLLGKVLGRPARLATPAWALRLAMGEMADEMLLASTRVRPGRLETSGFVWEHADLEGALRYAVHAAVDDRPPRP